MSQGQVQIQKTEQKQVQTVSQQQLLQAMLTELPVNQLIDRINTEMDDNPALELSSNEDVDEMDNSAYDSSDDASDTFGDASDAIGDTSDDYESRSEKEDRQTALDDALSSIGRDDEDLPVYQGGQRDVEYGSTQSFYDQLVEQMNETELTPLQAQVMEYLIGSLDDDGLLRKSANDIADELAIYNNIYVSEEEIETVVKILQQFDPPGVGARSLQQCLLIQIRRRDTTLLTRRMEAVVEDYFDDFIKNHWERIRSSLQMTKDETDEVNAELRRLNPKPGASMNDTVGRSMEQITPDFIVDTQDDGTVTFVLNNGEVPDLCISSSFADILKTYQSKENVSRSESDALLYAKTKVESAQRFINAVKMRHRTLSMTMSAIIHWQHRFFEDGDESSLRPMRLKDISDKTGLSISTISRVSNSKYALTKWGIFPLRHFFSDSYVNDGGEEMSTREIKMALKDIIDNEDKSNPLSDEALCRLLAEKGYPIARRTVSKYREMMGIPVKRFRKN